MALRARRLISRGFGAPGLGAISAPGPTQVIFAEPGTTIMTTLPWLLIPALLVSTHLAVFYRLVNPAPLNLANHSPR